MANYEKQLDRMNYLMGYRLPVNENKSNVEFYKIGADDKIYGIIKEGTKYYIKTADKNAKSTLAESYDYIGGFNNRRNNEFKSYNDATKHLELHMMSLNEKFGKHTDVSTVDFKSKEKALANLTEAARTELNRMKEIMENSCKIGMNCVCDTESKGKSTAEQTEKNNAPFEKKVEASLDKDPKFNGTLKDATENTEVKSVESDLQSDKMKTKKVAPAESNTEAHDDLDGEGVADKSPKGGKVVKMNESVFEDEEDIVGLDDEELEPDLDAFDVNDPSMPSSEENIQLDDELSAEPQIPNDNDVEPSFDDINNEDEPSDLDSLLEEFENAIIGPNKVLDGTQEGTDKDDAEWERVNEEDGNVNEPAKEGNEETMKSFQKKGNLSAQTWDKLSTIESLNRITDTVCEGIMKTYAKKETLDEKITRLVNEEVTRLNAWGKHPRFRKAPIELPDNKEVLAGSADRDFNDNSAKGNEPYGSKIGSSAPFDKKVEMIVDQVLSQIKENLKR